MWTFTLRQGVTFPNGQPMTADDVVYSFQSQTNPKVYVNAASAFSGVLTDTGVEKVDDLTVAFHLEAPNGNFPWLISSDNYNMIIVPKGYDYSKWEKTLHRHRPVQGEVLPADGRARRSCRNDAYWGAKALPGQLQFIFYDDPAARRSWRCRRARSTSSTCSCPRAPRRVLNNPKYNRGHQVVAASRARRCAATRRRGTTSSSARRWR